MVRNAQARGLQPKRGHSRRTALLVLDVMSDFAFEDGPAVRRFIDRNMGVPLVVSTTITGDVIQSLRRYFFGVSIVAAFRAPGRTFHATSPP